LLTYSELVIAGLQEERKLSRKRGNGEGSITKRKDGRWVARYTVHTAKGPKRKSIYGRTRQEVATKLAKAMSDRDGGIELDPSRVTVNEYLQRWLKDSVKGSVRPITFESYERLVRVHVVSVLGRIKLKALSPAHLQGFYRDRLDAGLSPCTVQRLHAVIHRALKQALRWGLVARNVSEAADPPKAQRKEIRPLTPEQVRTLLKAAQGDRLEVLYVLAITTGLRQGELFGLSWEDVDLATGRLSVRRTLTTPKGGRRLGPPKRSKSCRSVKLTAGAIKALTAHRERQLEEREKLAELWQDLGFVFATQVGTPLNRHNFFRRCFKPMLEKAGLPHTVRFHDLRHTCATILLSKNVNPKIVQELLGHANISQTMDTHSHVLPDMQERAASAMDDIFP
jgi:integrase